MDQSSAAIDVLQNTSSLISSLMSQLSGGGATKTDGFSELLAAGNDFQTTASTQTQTSAATGFNFSSNTAASSAAVTPFAASSSTLDNSSTDILQKLSDLSQTLHKMLAILRQHSDNASAQNNKSGKPAQSTTSDAASADQTQTATDANTLSSTAAASTQTTAPTTTTTTTPVAATTTDSTTAAASTSDTTDDSDQTLADIIAELLSLAQLMAKSLQQAQTAGGAATTSTTTTAAVGDTTAADASGQSADPLAKLMQLLEKAVKDIAPQTTDADTPATASNTPAAAPDIAAQFAALDAELKNIITELQQPTLTAPPTTDTDTIAAATNAATSATTTALAATQMPLPPAPAPAKPLASTQTTAPIANATTESTTTAPTVAAQIAARNQSGTESETDLLGKQSGGFTNFADNANASLSAEGVQATGTYNFASQLSAFRAANGGNTGLPSVVDQVILQMNRSVKNGNDQMSLQLQPGDMGKITVKLDFSSDGRVQGTVIADNPKTLDMLQKDSRSLERALQDAGLRADPGSLQFSLGGQTNQNNAGQTANNNNANANNQNADGEDGDIPMLDAGASAETYYITPGGVNIRV